MDALEKSLGEAFETDAKRKAEDDMKKRAIVTARSYDEFRHLVAAAQQKPLDRGDMDKKVSVAANRAASGVDRSSALGFLGLAATGAVATPPAPTLSSGAGTAVPTTPAEFDRAWRRLPKMSLARATYLASLGPSRLSSIFTADVDGETLGACVGALAQAKGQVEEGQQVEQDGAGPAGAARLALAFSSSAGFGLALDLLGDGDLQAVRTIAQAAGAQDQELAQALTQAYKL